MTLRPLDWLGWLLALVVWAAFFLPWFKLPSHKRGLLPNGAAIVRELTTDSDRSFWSEYFCLTTEEWKRATHSPEMGVTGLEIPRVYHSSSRKVEALFLGSSGLFGDKRQADNSYLVFAFPLVAFFAAAFVTAAPRKWALLLPLFISAALYGFVRFKLSDTYLERLTLSVDVGIGLWLSLYALLGLALVLLIRLILPASSRI